MRIRLLKLSLKNFKGIKSFELDTQGGNVRIYGDNATGKTTLFDAFVWLLFDKDSQNKKGFEIKTLDENGQPIHGLDHEVEAVLEIGGRTLTLRKVYKEKWTKKRGSATAEFTGHTTDYYIDSVPVKKSEYETQIAEIADENVFKLLTNPVYFNEQLHWQERRKILLQICGDISDEEVIASDPALAKLPEILQNRKLEDHRKVIAARRTEINKELEKIPIRIDEVQQGLPDVSAINEKKVQAEIEALKADKKEKEQELARIENGGEVAEKRKRLAEIETELEDLRRNYRASFDDKLEQKKKELYKIRDEIGEINLQIKDKKNKISINKARIERLESETKKLRQKWYEVNDQEFEHDDTCPTCGQPLPEEQIEEARANFNREKAERLETITAEGKSITAEIDDLNVENEKLRYEIDDLKGEIDSLREQEEILQSEITDLEQKAAAYQDSFQYKKKLAEKESLEQSIEGLQRNASHEAARIEKEIRGLENQIKIQEQRLAMVERYEQGQKRIKELKAQERQLAAEYEKLESELYLTEQFIRTKVKMLEEKINSRFKYARFKLFDVQVNGGVVECCETLYQGVPYSTGLNNAARINVGLDIINTLSEFYGFSAPIFIDNREAITKLVKTKGQIISLIVSEPDKTLRVETENKSEAEANLFKEVI
ncbi:MAG: hypothetical protein PWR10_1816 [Halanaerobiales bacterium]|nr:hypothetical protein [Halanaerobiales bacterium]